MDNRRESYRHRFDKTKRVPVLLECLDRKLHFMGTLLDLSFGGVQIEIDETLPALKLHESVQVTLWLPTDDRPMSIRSTVVHIAGGESETVYGIAFITLKDPAREEEREKRLWRCLYSEQVRARKGKIRTGSRDGRLRLTIFRTEQE